MFQIGINKRVKKKIINGPGFSLKVPESFVTRREDDPQEEWGYGEFFHTNTFDPDSDPQTNVFFFYWEKSKGELTEKKADEFIKTVCKEKVFSGEHLIERDEIFPVRFKRFPTFILKYRFSHHDPEVEGKASFFVINNIRLEKVFVLGTVVEAVGSKMIENETMAWIEDQVINTFRFDKNTN